MCATGDEKVSLTTIVGACRPEQQLLTRLNRCLRTEGQLHYLVLRPCPFLQ